MTALPAGPHHGAPPAEPRPAAELAVRPAPRFQPGGALLDGTLYVERAADRDLLAHLLQGELCYVLATRQIGKSSLRARVAERLRAEGVLSAHIDLTALGVREASAEGWYFGLTSEIGEQLGLEDPNGFWDARKGLGPVHVFSRYLEEVGRAAGRVAIFIDEIDATLALPFSRDDFFAALRAHVNHRGGSHAAAQVSLCLLGVAAPDDLHRRPGSDAVQRRPRGPAPRFFPRRDGGVRRGAPRIGGGGVGAARRAARVDERAPVHDPEDLQRSVGARQGQSVEAIVRARFLDKGKVEDANLAHVERFLDLRAKSGQVPRLLSMYGRVLEGESVAVDGGDPLQLMLSLAGLVGEQEEGRGRRLVVRNRIFREVYGPAWVRDRMAARPLGAATERWRSGGRRKADLLRGARLAEVQRWASGREDLTQDEQAFLEACARGTARSRLWIIAGLVVMVVLLAIAFGWAWTAQKRADKEAERAKQAEAEAEYRVKIVDAHRLAAMSEALGAEQEPERLLLAVEAVIRAKSAGPAVPAPIEQALIAAVSELSALSGDMPPIEHAAISADGSHVIVIDRQGTARLLTLPEDPPRIVVLPHPEARATSAAFSQDGSRMAVGYDDGAVTIMDDRHGALSLPDPRSHQIDAVR